MTSAVRTTREPAVVQIRPGRHRGEPITAADLARRSVAAPRTLARRFGRLTGTTPARRRQALTRRVSDPPVSPRS